MATAAPIARTAKPVIPPAAPKPTAVKAAATPGRKPGVPTGPVLAWNAERRNALIDSYKAGATTAAELQVALAKHPAFRGVGARVTTTKLRTVWGNLQKKMAKKGYDLPDLDRSGNGDPVDVDALWGRFQGTEGAEGDEAVGGEDLDLDGEVEEADEEFE